MKRRGTSEVISAVLLTAVVITVGGATWVFARNSTTIIAKDYIDGTIDQISYLKERFTIELTYYDKYSKVLFIYVYNYGSVDVTIDTYVTYSNTQRSVSCTSIQSKQGAFVVFDNVDDDVGIVNIKCHSWRANNDVTQYWIG
jgi:flagellin-like protein